MQLSEHLPGIRHRISGQLYVYPCISKLFLTLWTARMSGCAS